MSTQEALALPSPAPSNTVVINARCSLRIEADQRVIIVAGLPVHRRAQHRGGWSPGALIDAETGHFGATLCQEV